MVYAMSLEYKAPDVVGYKIDGTSITRKDLTNRVTSTSKRIKSGDFITQEEVEKEIENW
jgi:hypothetical protein